MLLVDAAAEGTRPATGLARELVKGRVTFARLALMPSIGKLGRLFIPRAWSERLRVLAVVVFIRTIAVPALDLLAVRGVLCVLALAEAAREVVVLAEGKGDSSSGEHGRLPGKVYSSMLDMVRRQ